VSGVVACAAVVGGDKTPDALNWANISGGTGADRSNADQTFTGITRPIQVTASWGAGQPLQSGTLYYVKNGAAKVAITNNAPFGPFVNNDTCHFVINGPTAGGPLTVTIQNYEFGTGSIDTFTVTLT
jgi:hypothetical protein